MHELSATGERLDLPVPATRRGRRAEDRNEPALVHAAQQGSRRAFGELIERHWESAHRAAFLVVRDRHAAEDIAQEAMLAAASAIHRFDRRRPLGPWIHRIVIHRSLDWLRARDRRRETPDAAASEIAGQAAPEPELSGDLEVAISSLEPADRALIVLRHVLDYRSREIARLMGMRPATVRTRLRRALARLRETLDATATERPESGGAP
jgi:RNA polymerase sigma-70 factor, ECF subfamily